jgi:allophanate hydrolase subunit 1
MLKTRQTRYSEELYHNCRDMEQEKKYYVTAKVQKKTTKQTAKERRQCVEIVEAITGAVVKFNKKRDKYNALSRRPRKRPSVLRQTTMDQRSKEEWGTQEPLTVKQHLLYLDHNNAGDLVEFFRITGTETTRTVGITGRMCLCITTITHALARVGFTYLILAHHSSAKNPEASEFASTGR